MAEKKLVGTVTHFFDKIMVAVVKPMKPIKTGDVLEFRGHDGQVKFAQAGASLQIEHETVETANKDFGLKVDQAVKEGDKIYR